MTAPSRTVTIITRNLEIASNLLLVASNAHYSRSLAGMSRRHSCCNTRRWCGEREGSLLRVVAERESRVESFLLCFVMRVRDACSWLPILQVHEIEIHRSHIRMSFGIKCQAAWKVLSRLAVPWPKGIDAPFSFSFIVGDRSSTHTSVGSIPWALPFPRFSRVVVASRSFKRRSYSPEFYPCPLTSFLSRGSLSLSSFGRLPRKPFLRIEVHSSMPVCA